MKNRLFRIKTSALFFIVVLLSGAFAYFKWQRQKPSNIIALSVCSLRKDVFSVYSQKPKEFYIDSLAERSIVLKQAISSDGVRGLSRYLIKILANEQSFKNYELINGENEAVIRLTRFDDPEAYFNSLEKKVSTALKSKKPFLLFPHIEYLHFPFAENEDAELDAYLLSQKSLSKTELSQRLPFFLALVPYDKLVNLYPFYFKPLPAPDALSFAFDTFKNPSSLLMWKNSVNFSDDRKLLLKFYYKKLKILDSYLEKFLSARENDSIIYLVGCHGQPFLEQKEFLHGNAIDEGTANIPAFIHFGGMKEKKEITYQTSMEKIVQTIESLAIHNLPETEFFKKARENLKEEIILQFDCRGQRFAIRNDGLSKYVQDFATGNKEFYDLTKDPDMLQNKVDELSSEQLSFYEKNLYKLFTDRLSSDDETLPQTGYCPYQIQLQKKGK